MLDGLDRGNQTLWKLYVAEDAMIFDEKGNNQDKKALIADIQPMPSGYALTLVVDNPKTRFAPNVAILSYDSREIETAYGQHLTARYHTTDTWLYRNHAWQIVADQTLRYYEDPAPSNAAVANLKDFTGTYELAPGVRM
ncbi:MAG: nuclear transport factor 2 family protein, partial [Acidobacteriota bacterium]|nr:nuclear transport factor 2 family protein [Acidobacteriota bacterium]